jgi:hypothetical protein
MKILSIIIVSIPLLFVVKIVFDFIRSTWQHEKRMKKLNQWNEFLKQKRKWANEIQDVDIKTDFLQSTVFRPLDANTSDQFYSEIVHWTSEEETKIIYEKWGHHIPSLRQQVREQKIYRLLSENI